MQLHVTKNVCALIVAFSFVQLLTDGPAHFIIIYLNCSDSNCPQVKLIFFLLFTVADCIADPRLFKENALKFCIALSL